MAPTEVTRSRTSPCQGHHRAKGFTLIELIVVIAVIALIMAAVPFVFTGTSALELRATSRGIAARLRDARSAAIVTNRQVAVGVDVDRRIYGVVGQAEHETLPADVEVRLFTALSERVGPNTGVIRFFPDGSSTGGRISLAVGSVAYHVDSDWLTGRVSILE